MPLKDKYLIIVAGGLGKRMQSATPKQFLELSGKPLLLHVFERFYAWDQTLQFILVLPENHFKKWEEICQRYSFDIEHILVKGGKERFDSVKNGLQVIEASSGLVGIHDGVRPLVSHQLMQTAFDTAELLGNAVPAIEVKESVRMIESDGNHVADRSKIRLIQTPQVFELKMIRKAYEQKYRPDFTDDATVLEAMGHDIHLVKGDAANIKITEPSDLNLAEYYLNKDLQ